LKNVDQLQETSRLTTRRSAHFGKRKKKRAHNALGKNKEEDCGKGGLGSGNLNETREKIAGPPIFQIGNVGWQ